MSDDENQKDLGTQGRKHSAKGKFNQVLGKVQQKAGEMLGNHKMQAKGVAREVGGKVESAVGDTEQKVDHTLKGQRNN